MPVRFCLGLYVVCANLAHLLPLLLCHALINWAAAPQSRIRTRPELPQDNESVALTSFMRASCNWTWMQTHSYFFRSAAADL